MNAKVVGLVVAAVLLASCRTVPIYNVKDAPVNTAAGQASSLAAVEQAIVRAGNQLGWTMKVETPTLITGTLNLRTHAAVVSIPFSTTSFSILYKSSANLDQQGDSIHKNYNSWVQNLEKAIRAQLLQ
ncbi:MAG: hypothetical protein ACREBN_09160 [Burkholderiaceae bacterium]